MEMMVMIFSLLQKDMIVMCAFLIVFVWLTILLLMRNFKSQLLLVKLLEMTMWRI